MDLTNLNKEKAAKQRRKSALDLGTMVYGKVPPQAKDLEEAVLGAIMLEKDAFDRIAAIIKPERFYIESHQRIFAAMERLAAKSQPIDILTVAEELKASEELDMVGGSYYVTKLTNAVVSSAHIEAHSKIVIQKFIQRELIRISGEIITEAYEDMCDPLELLEKAENLFTEINMTLDFGDMVGMDHVLVKAIQQIEDWRKLDSSITGVPAGLSKLDAATRGWQPGDLIILAARPSVGKTAFALNLARTASMFMKQLWLQHQGSPAKKGGPKKYVALFSLEMNAIMLALRMLAAESKELLYRIQTGRLNEEQMRGIYKNGIQMLVDAHIKFDDKPGLSIQKLKSKCRKMARKGELGMIIIDYLQLITPSGKLQNREQQVSEISRELKLLAAELHVPIIALSQMSRQIEQRSGPNRVPQLSDLRESGSLEQDADLVMFLYGATDEDIKQDPTLLNKRFLRIAKQRNGMLITQTLEFRDDIQFFQEATDLPQLGLGPGNWKPVPEASPDKFIESGARLYTQDDHEDEEEIPNAPF